MVMPKPIVRTASTTNPVRFRLSLAQTFTKVALMIAVYALIISNTPVSASSKSTALAIWIAGFNLTMEEVEAMLDDFVRTEGTPEVVQFSGGEPTIHPQIIDFVKAAKARGIPYVMINTNGKRIAKDDRFLEQLAEVQPSLYFQFD